MQPILYRPLFRAEQVLNKAHQQQPNTLVRDNSAKSAVNAADFVFLGQWGLSTGLNFIQIAF